MKTPNYVTGKWEHGTMPTLEYIDELLKKFDARVTRSHIKTWDDDDDAMVSVTITRKLAVGGEEERKEFRRVSSKDGKAIYKAIQVCKREALLNSIGTYSLKEVSKEDKESEMQALQLQ